MKTKISHLGRSTVSVILAVMMLLSTMLIGTVSTVNAASTLQPTTGVVADGYYRIFVTDNYKTNTTHKLFWWGSSKENPANWESSKSMNKLDGHNENSQDVYWYDIPSDITAFIIRPSDRKQSVDLTVSDADLKFSNGAGYYISGESNNKYEYAYWDASSLLPQETKPDVADSVALTANPTSVKVGNSVTLTPTVSSPKSDNLTYTYNKISGGTATEVKNADNSLTVTPTAAGTYEYTVTVSANGYSDVTSAKVTITASYTDTQQAYVDLENYVNSVKDTNAGSYTDDSFADFSTALKSAQAFLTGLPNADATNTDDYTTALNNLKVAYNNLKSNKQYYILGHTAITGGSADTSGETSHNNGVPMKDNGNGDYTYTFSSPDIKSGNDAFCFIDNNDKTYKTDNDQSINITDSKYTAENPYTVEISSATKGLYYIGNPTTSKRYTIHLNTATDGKIKVWVEEPPLPYGLQGAVYASQSDSNPIGWSNYSEAMSFNADNNYTLKFYAKNTNSNANQFRLIDSAQNTYGSNNASGLEVALNTNYTTRLSGNTYYVKQSDKPYTIRLTNPGKNPPEFVVTQGTQYSVTVAPDIENGTISVDKEKSYEGDTVNVTATPDSGYVLETVKFNGESAKVVGNTATFTMPNADVTVTATFRTAKEYKVTIANNITNGTVTANGSSKAITVTEGTSVKLVADPASSYSFSSWSITPEDGYTAEGSMTSATATIYPTADITVSASFAQGTASADHFLAWGEGEKIEDWTDGAKTYSSTDGNGKKNIYSRP